MKIAVISHAQVVPENRARWRALAARHADVTVDLIVPQHWHTRRYGSLQRYTVSPEDDGNFRIWPLQVWNAGDITGHFYQSPDLLLPRLQPDILAVYQEVGTRALLQVLLYRRLWAPRAKVTFFSYDNIGKLPRRPTRIWQRWFAFREADAAIAGNQEVRDELRRQGFRKPILVQTELGADETLFTPGDSGAERSAHGLSSFVVGYVGVLRELKGVRGLVEAVSHLEGKWSLLLVGDGPVRGWVEAFGQERGLSRQIRLAGTTERSKLPDLYRCMDVLVLPSRTTSNWKEQFGVVLVEAMLCGVPVVGSDSGAIPEVIGDAGFIFPEGDVQALVDRLRQLQTHSVLRRELAKRGRQRALAHFSSVALADQAYQFYCDLLTGKVKTGNCGQLREGQRDE